MSVAVGIRISYHLPGLQHVAYPSKHLVISSGSHTLQHGNLFCAFSTINLKVIKVFGGHWLGLNSAAPCTTQDCSYNEDSRYDF